MINDRIESTRTLIRRSLYETRAATIEAQNTNINSALDYFEMQDDHEDVKDKLKERYAVGIRKNREEGGYETYTRHRITKMIDEGGYETITSGIGRKIIESRLITTNKTQSWDYVGDDEESADDEQTTIIREHREAGNCYQALADTDWISCAVDTGILFVDYAGRHLRYSPVSPACIYVKYHDTITDDGVDRGVSYKDLEDASCVVLEMSTARGDGQSELDKQQYLAIFGRSTDYPQGRYVHYTARQWQEWPKDLSPGDYLDKAGNIANPLSLAVNADSQYAVEYPLVLLQGGLSVTTDTLIPVSTSLWESCLELDMALSRTLKDALKSALGSVGIKNPNNNPLPECFEGWFAMGDGQEAVQINFNGANAQVSLEIIQQIARTVAEGFGVPGHKIFAHSSGVPESGIALYVKSQPLVEHRERRVSINKSKMDRLFQIEKGILYALTGNDPAPGLRQVWSPGRWILPEDPEAKQRRLKMMLDNKAISYVRFIRDSFDLATDKDAKNYIEKMQEQDTEYTPPTQPTARPAIGIMPRPPRTGGM